MVQPISTLTNSSGPTDNTLSPELYALAQKAADAALDKKAKRLVLLDINPFSDMCDLQLICSGDSDRQTKAIADSILKTLAADGVKPERTEGNQEGQWILMDYGRFNVHIFFDYLRDYYSLESLWPQAKFVHLELDERASFRKLDK